MTEGHVRADPTPARGDGVAGLAAVLWELAGRLHRDAVDRRVPPAVPPPDLERRLNGGSNWSIARYYAGIVTNPPLPPGAHVLDMGCGYGRIALALTHLMGRDQRYVGLDPHAEAVEWAQQNITTRHPHFVFTHVDIANGAYNERGEVSATQFRFPFEDGSLDVVLMTSVATHVDIDTVRHYVSEAARTLNPVSGRLVATFFLLDPQVEDLLAQGRSPFRMPWPLGPSRVENPASPELAIAHPRELVLSMLRDAGFADTTVAQGSWSGREGTGPMDYQDLVVAHRGPGPLPAAAGVLDREHDGGGPDELQRTAVARRVARLEEVGVDTVTSLRAVLRWAVPAVVNALWWQASGLTLTTASEGDGDGEPIALSFEHCRALGLDDATPQAARQARFTPVDDGGIMDLLVAAGACVTREAILDAIVEIVRNGVAVRTALGSGRALVLRSSSGRSWPVSITVGADLPPVG